jgi:hypothetical protein
LTLDPLDGITPDQVVVLDLGVVPSPAGSGELLLHSDTADAYLILLANDRAHRRLGPVILTFVGCKQSLFGYPNDEAGWGDPRLRGKGYNVLEILDSPWSGRLDDYNRQAFPDRTVPRRLRHFVVSCHENLAQFLAEHVRVDVWPDPFEGAVTEALRRLWS